MEGGRLTIRKYLPIVLILLVAFGLRAFRLMAIPPGLTHDEANHGREAIGILGGVLLFYFPLNYGSEPLYSYVVAGLMGLVGENVLALRLVNVYFSVLTIAMTVGWARRALGRPAALVGGGLLAVSFWPVVAGRLALRAGMLPFLMAAAVWFFWKLSAVSYQPSAIGRRPPAVTKVSPPCHLVTLSPCHPVTPLAPVLFGVAVALTVHTYLAARVTWLLFPLFLAYLLVFHRPLFKRAWRPVWGGLALAGVLVAPMFLYLQAHPEAETRLEMLDRPLQALRAGNLRPLLENAGEAILALFWPGYGDHFLAYNIPGRPVLDGVTAIFFVVGVGVCLWRWRRPAYAFLLLWFAVGILPSLVTGAEANTTRNLAVLPAAYLLPAVGFGEIFHRWTQMNTDGGRAKVQRRQGRQEVIMASMAVAWVALVGVMSGWDYFGQWAERPDVRGAYQHTLIEALAYVEERPVVMSSVYPGAAHDPSIAQVVSPEYAPALRWVDGRRAMLFPDGKSVHLIAPASTPLHPVIAAMGQAVESVALWPDDLDPFFTLYQMEAINWTENEGTTNFGDGVRLVEARWLNPAVRPGGTAELLTVWRVIDPGKVGPIVPPIYTTDVVLFTHILNRGGTILAQDDRLDAPSWGWQAGDVVVQIHQMGIPAGTAAGEYAAEVGIYDRLSGERLPVVDGSGQAVDNRVLVEPLEVR